MEEEITHLNQSTGSARVGYQQPHIIDSFIGIQPINTFARQGYQLGPLFHRQAELEMGRTGVADSHENAPEHHAYACVKKVENA